MIEGAEVWRSARRRALGLAASLLIGMTVAAPAVAQPPGRDDSGGPRPTASVEPFAAIAAEVARGNSARLRFKRTELDDRARATARVARRGRLLLVRVEARDLPPPSRFNQRHYVLWVDVPNYGQKLFIGDLPLTSSQGSPRRSNERGNSDTAYYYTLLPEGAVFGGLMLTAEPRRYVPIPSEPLQLLLVALPPEVK
jgi:hypothetical protein